MAPAANDNLTHRLAKLLAETPAVAAGSPASDVERALLIARKLQGTAREMQTSAERRQQAELDRMIQSPADKATMVEITDQAFRAQLSPRAADQLIHILDVQGVPRFFGPLDRTLLKGFQSFGAYLPGVAMPLVKEKMQQETANVVLPAEEDLLRQHLEDRRHEGLRMNVNYLGESLLGEEDAQARLKSYLQALQEPFIEVMSVKISTIYSQISGLAREHTIEVLCDRLELLYRAAAKNKFRRHDGQLVSKFVYLDMEEYRDKEITSKVFMRTLDRPGFEQLHAGIALQAYIPDSFATQRRITEWARRRVEQGGAPATIRVVKGANMEMERVEASLRGWPLATFSDKLHTDANYHRMLQYGMQPENLAAVRLGVASHNLFSIAYGLVLAAQSGQLDHVQFEMLEGMANHQRRALFELAENLLLYAPACRQEDFINAIGYLVRRLDENTGPDNFLRYAFNLEVGGATWNRLEQNFVASFDAMQTLTDEPRRVQDRTQESTTNDSRAAGFIPAVPPPPAPLISPTHPATDFTNAPDTDWSLPANSDWGADILARWQPRHGDNATQVPLVIAGEQLFDDREVRPSTDPSRPKTVVAKYRQATANDAAHAVQCAAADPDGWRRLPPRERTATLHRVADELARRRGDLMGAMLAEGGKLLTESDPEISEAIDFCCFYAETAQDFYELPGLAARGRGVVIVVSPWNFPLAIPCGGVAAALAAGNTVILKPASDTVLIAHALCECFWAAGVPRTALQFVPCSGATVGQQLISHHAVDAVILTGGTETALDMLHRKPSINLLAETGGKNATIVTALSDRDLAIKNVLHSAFSHSGQKCSATSLLILEEEVYEDAKFRATLCDAVESLRVGSAWELHSKMGPLIRPPSGDLERALKELEGGESWAVMPRLHVDGNASLVSPGVKWGVQPGSITHLTEFFGPLLGVMSAKNLHAAIDLVNATGYGLTSGLESLDDREHRIWQEGIRAGNLYINRPTTGAIVLRQPFGGLGKSAFGPGIKAGGPNYVAPLMAFEDKESPANQQRAGGFIPPVPAAQSSRAEELDIVFPPDSLILPHESVAERQTHLHSLRHTLAALGQSARLLLTAADLARLDHAIDSYLAWTLDEFEPAHDHFLLVGEDNLRRYRAVANVRLRVADGDAPWDVFARAAAARAAGCRVVVSSSPALPESLRQAVALLDGATDNWAGAIEFITESDEQLVAAIQAGGVGRLRYADRSRVPDAIRIAATEAYVYIADAPVLAHGRVELLWYQQEQSLSHVYHRYGNLGRRADEPRAEVS
ncbi:proline dehydrogenase family protein [Lacipirellula parvula]|uniref:L-glutamate gamma-semialdehyde dehydrogenase n=1 Tax=Lacipirellula parvula TaxID=2650471 RepID=A0A5K7X7V2_9BACT|nr:proline dehydrogenase family protein [Lacipirellula parvula]BBO30396.1 proline dehydrogenase [Lacipirellula parvula]